MEPTETKSNSALVGVTVIILILILGGIYFWQSNAKTGIQENTDTNTTTVTTTTEDGETTTTTETYIELENLEKEVENTEIEAGVDVEAIQ
jgi:hypothetical protein